MGMIWLAKNSHMIQGALVHLDAKGRREFTPYHRPSAKSTAISTLDVLNHPLLRTEGPAFVQYQPGHGFSIHIASGPT